MIISCPPSQEYPSGILSIQIHQITGLEFEKMRKSRDPKEDGNDAEEGTGDLPSSYCTIILNHQKIFKTRTKPKNDKPFFNAGTERFIRDWRTTEFMLSVRDARVHEDDPLIGIVYFPLAHIFRSRSQIMETYPLVGGLGYGRVRVSVVFRSVRLQVPKELMGWDYGTLEITGPITSKNLLADLRGLRLKLRTNIHRVKMYSASTEGQWAGKKDRKVRLAVRKRYSSCLVIEFRKNQIAFDKTSAFAVFWLKDIPDDEEQTVTLTVWQGDTDMKRAESNCLDKMGASSGTIDVPMKFWHGLSGVHARHAGSNANMKDVLEVLDTAYDSKEVRQTMAGIDDSDSDDSEDGAEHSPSSSERRNRHNQESGGRDPWDQVVEYKDHSDQLHRSHRGIMQWKVSLLCLFGTIGSLMLISIRGLVRRNGSRRRWNMERITFWGTSSIIMKGSLVLRRKLEFLSVSVTVWIVVSVGPVLLFKREARRSVSGGRRYMHGRCISRGLVVQPVVSTCMGGV